MNFSLSNQQECFHKQERPLKVNLWCFLNKAHLWFRFLKTQGRCLIKSDKLLFVFFFWNNSWKEAKLTKVKPITLFQNFLFLEDSDNTIG